MGRIAKELVMAVKSCLVTGGCGFIGSHVVDLLVERGYQVSVIDDLSTGKLSNLNGNAQFIQGSILDNDLVRDAMQDIDWVFHLAAIPKIQQSVDDPIGTHKINVNGTLTLLRHASNFHVKKFIYSSSASIYGRQAIPNMQEDMVAKPNSPYAIQKYMSELYMGLWADTYKLPTVSLRYFNVYGKRQSDAGDYPLVIANFLKQKKNGQPMTIFGDGTQTRDYVNVKDVALANLAVAKADLDKYFYSNGYSPTFNVGSGKETSLNELARRIGGKTEYITPNPRASFDVERNFADMTMMEEIVGWKAKIDLEDGLKELK